MKRLFLILFLSIGLLNAQDTLLYEGYQYSEVVVTDADLLDIGNTSIELLPAITNDTTYYDVFKIILLFHSDKPDYVWSGDNLAIGIGNSTAFIPCEFITSNDRVAVINALTGRFGLTSPNAAVYGNSSRGASIDNSLRMISWLETSPTLGEGWIKVKIWYKIRVWE